MTDAWKDLKDHKINTLLNDYMKDGQQNKTLGAKICESFLTLNSKPFILEMTDYLTKALNGNFNLNNLLFKYVRSLSKLVEQKRSLLEEKLDNMIKIGSNKKAINLLQVQISNMNNELGYFKSFTLITVEEGNKFDKKWISNGKTFYEANNNWNSMHENSNTNVNANRQLNFIAQQSTVLDGDVLVTNPSIEAKWQNSFDITVQDATYQQAQPMNLNLNFP